MHAAHLIVEGRKMSKSLGNFYTLRDLIGKGFSGRVIRWLLLQTHYRIELNFSLASLEASGQSLKRIDDFLFRLREAKKGALTAVTDSRVPLFASEMQEGFQKALADDLNISQALALLFDFIRFINGKIDEKALSLGDIAIVEEVLTFIDRVLGVIFVSSSEEIPADILLAAEKRALARQLKDWKLADEMRAWIRSKGYDVEDTPGGPKINKL
jgi:cysteinyl-tRNA synthetase